VTATAANATIKRLNRDGALVIDSLPSELVVAPHMPPS
jgi:hypothetical protein